MESSCGGFKAQLLMEILNKDLSYYDEPSLCDEPEGILAYD
jgi:hypothetical protein